MAGANAAWIWGYRLSHRGETGLTEGTTTRKSFNRKTFLSCPMRLLKAIFDKKIVQKRKSAHGRNRPPMR